ncbi:MAG: hypothetical protein ACLU8W_08845 [Clostridia bacterium]
MRTILLYGSDTDISLTFPLCRVLERYGGVLHLHGGAIGEYSDAAPEFLIYETNRLESIQLNHGLLLMKEQAPSPPGRPGISGVDALILPDTSAIPVAPSLPLIRCGTSNSNTMMLSSLDEHHAVATLGRTLCISGRTYEPHDIPIQLTHPISPYPLLACCAVLMLSLGGEGDPFCI